MGVAGAAAVASGEGWVTVQKKTKREKEKAGVEPLRGSTPAAINRYGLCPVNTQSIRERPCSQPRCAGVALRDRISSEKL